MSEQDRQGAVPGITVHANGGATIDTPEAISFFRLLALRGAIKLEALGMKRSGRSATAIAKREFGIQGSREKVVAFLEARIEAERVRQNAPKAG